MAAGGQHVLYTAYEKPNSSDKKPSVKLED